MIEKKDILCTAEWNFVYHYSACLWIFAKYLQSYSDPLSERSFGKNCLHLGHHCAAEDSSLRTNQITVLLDARDHRKVLREIPGNDATNTPLLQLLRWVQLWRTTVDNRGLQVTTVLKTSLVNKQTDLHPCRWVSGWVPPGCVHSDALSNFLQSRCAVSPVPSLCLAVQRSEGFPRSQDWKQRAKLMVTRNNSIFSHTFTPQEIKTSLVTCWTTSLENTRFLPDKNIQWNFYDY